MKKFVAAAAFAILAASAQAETAGETLLVPPFPAATPWKTITDKTTALMLMREWIPADQSEDDIKDILTEQHIYRSGLTPAGFIKQMFADINNACTSLRVNGPIERVENGFSVAYAQLYCAREKSSGKGVDIFLKAIAGTKAFYVVQYEIRRPADKLGVAGVTVFGADQLEAVKALMARQSGANKYLGDQVKLCAAIDAAGACLPGTVPAQAAPPPQTSPQTPASKGSVRRLSDDVSADYGFVPGKTTADEVRKKFGKPVMENHNPDGRFVLMFDAPDGTGHTLGCLFGQDGTLSAIRLYGTD